MKSHYLKSKFVYSDSKHPSLSFIIQGDEVDKTQERRTVIDFERKRQGSDRQVTL